MDSEVTGSKGKRRWSWVVGVCVVLVLGGVTVGVNSNGSRTGTSHDGRISFTCNGQRYSFDKDDETQWSDIKKSERELLPFSSEVIANCGTGKLTGDEWNGMIKFLESSGGLQQYREFWLKQNEFCRFKAGTNGNNEKYVQLVTRDNGGCWVSTDSLAKNLYLQMG